MTQLLSTTVSGAPTSQTVFVLTAGSDVDDAYNGQTVILEDASNSDYPSVRHHVVDYVGSTKTLTINTAANFTLISGDGVKIILNTLPTQTRINQPAGSAYRLAISSTADGTYKATKPVRLRPGAVDVAVSVDMRPQFGDDFVDTVAAPNVSAGSITAAALGPRDTEAMVQLAGTATASEERTVEFLVTMSNGDAVLVTFDVIVFAD